MNPAHQAQDRLHLRLVKRVYPSVGGDLYRALRVNLLDRLLGSLLDNLWRRA